MLLKSKSRSEIGNVINKKPPFLYISMKLKTFKSFISRLKHLTTEYTNFFSTEKLILDENQYKIGGFFAYIYKIILPFII